MRNCYTLCANRLSLNLEKTNFILFHTPQKKDWFYANRLSLNLEKTNFILFHTPQKKDWFYANRLSLNLEKTNFIVFHTFFILLKNLTSSNVVLNEIVIDGVTIKQVSNSKFLGVIIDEHLTWSHHINLVANKVA